MPRPWARVFFFKAHRPPEGRARHLPPPGGWGGVADPLSEAGPEGPDFAPHRQRKRILRVRLMLSRARSIPRPGARSEG